MKTKFIITLLFVIFGLNILSAQSISLNYNSVHIGRNVSALYNYSLDEHHQIYGGLKYHINTIVRSNQNYAFKKSFHAYDFKQTLGLEFGYHYNIPIKNGNELFGFYDNQFTFAGTRSVASIKEPFKAMEHNFGVGLRAGLWKNLSATFKMGGGIALFWNLPFLTLPSNSLFDNRINWEFSGIISAGFEYDLN
ncbi:MAG: hypothetical protein HC803_01400 [Saprospiraceae bacterium]|nr:hypothetical protein [Saprospiraceae bacterium]